MTIKIYVIVNNTYRVWCQIKCERGEDEFFIKLKRITQLDHTDFRGGWHDFTKASIPGFFEKYYGDVIKALYENDVEIERLWTEARKEERV